MLRQKILFLLQMAMLSLPLFSQREDSVKVNTAKPIPSELTTELCFSIASPGITMFTSNLDTKVRNQFYANLLYLSYTRDNLEIAFHMNGGDIHLKDSLYFDGKIWDKDAGLKTLSLGITAGYKIINHHKLILKPYAGIMTSFVSYTYQNGNSMEAQNSKTTLCPLIGFNLEYRFLFKNLWRDYDNQHKLFWSDRFWSLLLQSGYIPSPFRKNLGIKGNAVFCTLGIAFHIGKYENNNPGIQ